MKKILLILLYSILYSVTQAGTYRTKADGDYHDASIWEYSNGSSWSPVSQYPIPAPHEKIFIGHDVTINTNVFLNGYIDLSVQLGSLTFNNGSVIHSYTSSTINFLLGKITINQSGSFMNYADNSPSTPSTGCFDGYLRDSVAFYNNLQLEYNDISNIVMSEFITDYYSIELNNSNISLFGANVHVDTLMLKNSSIGLNGTTIHGMNAKTGSVIHLNTANNQIINATLFNSQIINDNSTNTINHIKLDNSDLNLNASLYFQSVLCTNSSEFTISCPVTYIQSQIIHLHNSSKMNINGVTNFDANCDLEFSSSSQMFINSATTFGNIAVFDAGTSVTMNAPVTISSSGFNDSLCNYITTANAELHLISNLQSVIIPKVSTLKKLEISIGAGGYAYLQQNLSITDALGLELNTGDIYTSSYKLILEDDTPLSFSGSSRVCGNLSIKVQTSYNSNESIYYPIGINHYSIPLKITLSTNGIGTCYLTASVNNTIPSGTANMLTLGGAMSNVFYNLKVEQPNPLYNSNNISSIASIELKPFNISPALSNTSKIGFSYDNTALSYEGIPTTFTTPYLTSASLNSSQIDDLGSADGSFIGVAKNVLAPGDYCVGPSSAYTAPAGSPAYQNANEPYGNLSLALNALQTLGCNGHVTFVLQNNYTGIGGGPNYTPENIPISISYQGDVTRKLTITTRTDNTIPLLMENTKTNGIGIIEFNGARYVTINGSVNNTCGEYGIRLRNNASYSLNFAPGYSNGMSFKNDAKHITISGIQFEVADRGIHFDNNTATLGSDSITISCNKFMVRSDLLNINCHPIGISFDHNGFANPTTSSNDITVQYNKFENMKTGIYLYEGISGKMTIANNHFYRNINNSPGPGFQHFIYNGKPINFIIDQNYFGGSEPFCSGAKMNTGNAQYLLLLGAGTPSSNIKSVMSNNRFENMTMGNTLYGAQVAGSCVWDIIGNRFGNPNVSHDLSSSSNTTFYGIYNITSSNAITNSLVSTIKDNSFNNIQCTSATGDIFNGIYFNGPASSIKNNSFKNIVHAGTSSFQMIYAASYTPMVGQTNEFSYNTAESIIQSNTNSSNDNIGIFKVLSGAGLPITLNCVGNRIGSLTNTNDILFNGSLIRPFSIDIWQHATNVDSNTICNVTLTNVTTSPNVMLEIVAKSNASCAYNSIFNINSKSKYNSPETSTPHASLTGIILNCNDGFLATTGQIHHNKIYNLTNSNSTPQTYGIGVAGLIIKGNSQNISSYTIYNNEVSRLTNQAISSGTNPYVFGIAYNASTKSLWYNNTISISNDPYSNVINMTGVRKFTSGNAFRYYHNTVQIGGIHSAGTTSFCLFKSANTFGTDTMMNNIFYSISDGGINYCLGSDHNTAAYWGKSNYNSFFSSDPNQLGKWLNSTMPFPTWKTTTSTEANSLINNVKFVDAETDLHLNANTNCALNNAGISIPIIAMDMDGDTRNNPPDIGADEFTYIDPTVTATAINPTTCEGANLYVNAVSSSPLTSLNYSWTGPNSYTSSTQNNSISNAQAIHQGTYSVTVTDFYGCSSSSTVSVTVAPTVTWYYDEDGDGYSVGATVTDCVSPGAHYTLVSLGVDCDDVNATIHPSATEICGNNIDDNCDGNIDEGCNTVNILAGKLWLQGYYIGGEQMNPVLSYQGVAAPTSIADSIYLELRDENSPTVITYSTMTTLGVDGEFTAIDIPSNLVGQSYYLVVKHRNSIETWSANAIQLTSYTYHNFTTAANKAYGENQIEMETNKWAFYTGDINQDGFVDSFDFPALDTDIFNGVSSAYVNTDLNGDGFVDSFDFPMFDVNSFNGVSVITP